MKLSDFFQEGEVRLDLRSGSKDEVLTELVGLLDLERKPREILLNLLRKREALGSTGIGHGVAIPHSRSLVVDRLQVAFGRKLAGIEFGSIDGHPVRYFFLIVAPPLEVSNQYLPVLGTVAQFCKNGENLERLAQVASRQELIDALDASGA